MGAADNPRSDQSVEKALACEETRRLCQPQAMQEQRQQFRRQFGAVISDVGALFECFRPGGGFHRIFAADDETAVDGKIGLCRRQGCMVGQAVAGGEVCALRAQAGKEAFRAGDGG